MNKNLSNLASNPYLSKGRVHEEIIPSYTDNFQIDKSKIIQSNAFRRLQYKTQVFINHEGDHFRNRLTHSLEVSSISSIISHALSISYNLAESISLAHDLGHPPFGHEGENMLNKCMEKYEGFNHNIHTIKIITRIEKRNPNYDGLNLTWETLEGLIKHNKLSINHIPQVIDNCDKILNLNLAAPATLEAQIAAISDDIAYVSHDMEDGLRYGLIKVNQLKDLPIIEDLNVDKLLTYDISIIAWQITSYIQSYLIKDVINTVINNITENNIESHNDFINFKSELVNFSEKCKNYVEVLKNFLRNSMYKHPHILDIYAKCQIIIEKLFYLYMNDINLIPKEWRKDKFYKNLSYLICDYIACMTDRFAIAEFYSHFKTDFNSIKI